MKNRYLPLRLGVARLFFALLLGALVLGQARASDLRISNELFFTETKGGTRTMYAIVQVHWKNAWRNELNHDAAWIFCKFLQGEEGFRHVRLRPNGHEILQARGSAGLQVTVEVPADGNGLFVLPKGAGRGDVSVKLKLAVDAEFLANFNPDRAQFKAYGLEMVHIPTGSFWAGEPDSAAAYEYSAFFLPDGTGGHSGPLRIDSEQALTVGRDIAYRSKESYYQGDGQGVLPDAFPKGYRGFYVMKYEISQGAYAGFLNALSREQSQMRANFGGKG
ncbi:MAG: hypothetical protein IT260_22810, partial [Saprospiraceae bacterium]|nr:hypothetical protein [Saprospiraceae bacterium]